MIIINHHYSLTPEWQDEVIEQFNAKHINNEITIVPESLGKGQIFFTQIIPGLSVHIIDIVFTTEVTIKRYVSDQDLYILQYDMSEKSNKLIVEDILYNIGNKSKIGLVVLDNQIASDFIPVVGERTFALRLTVDKKLLNLHIKKDASIKTIEKNLFYYNYIDSESKILIHSLKNKSVFDLSYRSFIKGISIKIFANFINFYLNPKQSKNTIVLADSHAVKKASNYLLNNLNNQFPSIQFLSKMAGMSTTKFKLSFAKIHNTSPNKYFKKEKMILANNLLKSKHFGSITEVTQVLNYSKPSYFNTQYNDYYGYAPRIDFIKKSNINLPFNTSLY